MSGVDAQGCPVTGASPAALQAYEAALAAVLGWRSGADALLALALQDSPGFVMARVLQAYLLVSSRDPKRVASARPMLARMAQLPANVRERLHIAAIAAAVDDDFDGVDACLSCMLRLQPRDVLALHVAHALDHTVGAAARMGERVAAVLPAWSGDVPGRHAVLAMHAFSLGERGEYERAEEAAGAAIALNPLDARAHHVMAHVFETAGRAREGLRWMEERVAAWSVGTTVAVHCWWHLALFRLAQGQPGHALAVYDRHVRRDRSAELNDLIDAASLLWRIQLNGTDIGTRWDELAVAWAPHIDDAFCSFNDLHAMLAFVGARDWEHALQLESALAGAQSRPTRHGATTRLLGLSACRALIAFGRGDNARAVTLLAGLSALAHRLGGSHAQRDVLDMTLQEAAERIRRPASRAGIARSLIATQT